MLQRGKEVMSALGPNDIAMMVVSRPYNGVDPGINLNIPKKLRELGVLAIPMDFFPLDQPTETGESTYHYWRFGQKILGAAEILRNDPSCTASTSLISAAVPIHSSSIFSGMY